MKGMSSPDSSLILAKIFVSFVAQSESLVCICLSHGDVLELLLLLYGIPSVFWDAPWVQMYWEGNVC